MCIYTYIYKPFRGENSTVCEESACDESSIGDAGRMVYTYTCIHTNIFIRMHTYTHTYTDMHINNYIDINTFIHIYKHIQGIGIR
jgi:hypothetical protein